MDCTAYYNSLTANYPKKQAFALKPAKKISEHRLFRAKNNGSPTEKPLAAKISQKKALVKKQTPYKKAPLKT